MLRGRVGMIEGESALVSVTIDQAIQSAAMNVKQYNDSPYKENDVSRARSLVKKLNQEKRDREIKN